MRKIGAKKIEDFLIVLSIFVSSIVFFKQPFEGYFHYLIFLLYLPFFISRYGLPVKVLQLLAIPTITSLIYLVLGENTAFGFFKIFMGLLLSCSFYYYVLVHYDFSSFKLFKLYLKGAIVVCYIGLFQAASVLIRFRFGYDYKWLFNKWGLAPGGLTGIRINSIFSEPSQFAIIISPAVFIAILNLITRRYVLLSRTNCLIVILAMIVSTSSTGYLGIFLSGIIIAINFRRVLDVIIIFFFVVMGAYFSYKYVDEFRYRVDAYVNLLQKDQSGFTLEDINSSSFVQYNNIQVATKSFLKHPIAGTGFGSYPMAYEKYSITKEEDFAIKEGFDFNAQDANSLFLRVMTEMGLIGIVFLLLLVYKCFVIRQEGLNDNISWIISGSVLVLILLYFLRQGNYFINGFPFFLWLYYYNSVNFKDYKDKVINASS